MYHPNITKNKHKTRSPASPDFPGTLGLPPERNICGSIGIDMSLAGLKTGGAHPKATLKVSQGHSHEELADEQGPLLVPGGTSFPTLPATTLLHKSRPAVEVSATLQKEAGTEFELTLATSPSPATLPATTLHKSCPAVEVPTTLKKEAGTGFELTLPTSPVPATLPATTLLHKSRPAVEVLATLQKEAGTKLKFNSIFKKSPAPASLPATTLLH